MAPAPIVLLIVEFPLLLLLLLLELLDDDGVGDFDGIGGGDDDGDIAGLGGNDFGIKMGIDESLERGFKPPTPSHLTEYMYVTPGTSVPSSSVKLY